MKRPSDDEVHGKTLGQDDSRHRRPGPARACRPHEELRTWALKQLTRYGSGEELPLFREVAASLEVTVQPHRGRRRLEDSRQISPHQIPQELRDCGFSHLAPIRHGVGEIEALIAMGWPVEITLPGAVEYTEQVTDSFGDDSNVLSLHWRVPVTTLRQVLDRIRTRLTQFVAEVRAAMPEGQHRPNPAQIGSAARNTFSFSGGSGTTVINIAADGGTASVNDPAPMSPNPWWHRSSVIWTATAAVATVAGVIAIVVVAR
ncbi:hypothetical protein ABZ330_35490 [Streptomyces sp. NPDC006172]|uniref:AbiTii domain-containing protein n=1 Tax=Streptomyces sp. NPDC006172 TaxID=3154470 RepID=UPI003402AE96